ncbi:MAG: TIGR03619 family F420-dependent LLM class oxidoreductase, partial [Gammaproteobacteria bacterium]|nr:TIGR03619 family F420-dependent LLM class oxidoreductase [Gammaproteobacteria bacterium]
GDLPREYINTYDPFVALSACAAVTNRIKLGTGICLIVERDVITLAKETATLDRMSGGRLILGIGAGWLGEEMENHGVDFNKRWQVTREKVLALRQLWTQEAAEYHGEFVDFDPVWSNPKPVQPNGPQIWMGATSKWSFDRIAEYCDGWLPAAHLTEGLLPEIEAAMNNRGRKMSELTLSLFASPPDEEFITQKKEEGFTHFVFGLPAAGPDEVLPILDQYAALAEKMR